MVLFIGMFVTHPIILGIILIGGVLSNIFLVNGKMFVKDIFYYFILFLLLALTNPLFSHNGETILFFMNDKPITMEAILYGGTIALMIIGVIYWCKCYQSIMTVDKFLYLFSKMIPKLALIISMAIRFIPLFRRQAKVVFQVQRTIGLYSSASIVDRILGGLRVFDSLLMWSIENSVETANSMLARGYGGNKRSNYTIFTFYKRDIGGMIFCLTGFLCYFIGWKKGIFEFHFYPYLSTISGSFMFNTECLIITIFMFFPTLITIKEKLQWKYLKLRT